MAAHVQGKRKQRKADKKKTEHSEGSNIVEAEDVTKNPINEDALE